MGIVEGAVVGGGIGIMTGGATGYGVARAIERTMIAEIAHGAGLLLKIFLG